MRSIRPETHGRTLRIKDLVKVIQADYQANGRRSMGRMNAALRYHLLPKLGGRRPCNATAAARQYILARSDEKAARATLQYELAILKRMLHLSAESGLIRSIPYIPSVHVQNARPGFFEPDQLERLLERLPGHLADAVMFAAATGWRREEVFGLIWSAVDFPAATVRLEPGTTKNGEGRLFPFRYSDVLWSVLERRQRLRQGPYVFHKNGKRVRDFRRAWLRACTRAQVSGRVFHDLRRTTARNMERAGVPRSTAMKLMGVRTEEMYRRYSIVSERDLSDGVRKLNEFMRGTEN